jgi:hypothetical protein
VGDGSLSIGPGEAVLSTDIQGVPFDVRIDREGLRIETEPRNRERLPGQPLPQPPAEPAGQPPPGP